MGTLACAVCEVWIRLLVRFVKLRYVFCAVSWHVGTFGGGVCEMCGYVCLCRSRDVGTLVCAVWWDVGTIACAVL